MDRGATWASKTPFWSNSLSAGGPGRLSMLNSTHMLAVTGNLADGTIVVHIATSNDGWATASVTHSSTVTLGYYTGGAVIRNATFGWVVGHMTSSATDVALWKRTS